jgi:hypothetical protein
VILLALQSLLILTERKDSSVSVPDGKPVIGFVPDLSNVLIATGHEGSGLALVSGLCKPSSVNVSSFFVLSV